MRANDVVAAARDLRKAFPTGGRGTVEVLRGISLEVRAGEMVSIVGRSGSGKSTLLYCLSGLDRPTSGSVELAGERLDGASSAALARIRARRAGFIFQQYNLIESLNVGDNVLLPARLAGHAVTREQLKEALAAVSLTGFERRRPADLSGGEQQRVAVARALAARPQVVFADEPTGALDSSSSHTVLDLLRAVADGRERSVILVTHDLEAASRADRVLVLHDGLLVRELVAPTPQDVFRAMEEER